MSGDLPACGLYRTGVSLPGHEDAVPAGRLVHFHNHSTQGPPIVLVPESNTANRWTFHERGWLVEDPGFIKALVPLLPEGLYVVARRHLHLSREEMIPEQTLVQVGYNRSGDTILFPARFEGTTITFPDRGFRFESPKVQEVLDRVNFKVPAPRSDRLLH